MKTFRCLPHGTYTLIPTILTTMAWLISLSQDGCDYARITGPIVNKMINANSASDSRNEGPARTNSTEKSMIIPFLELGLSAYRAPTFNMESNNWEIDYRGDCLSYDTAIIDMDDAWTASKMFAFLGLVLGGGGSVFLWISSCCIFSPGTWRWAGYEVLLAFLFQMLSFSWFVTDICHRGACSLGWGSKTNIYGSFCWGFASYCIFCKYPAPRLLLLNHQEDHDHDRGHDNEFDDTNEDLKPNFHSNQRDNDDDMSTLITLESDNDDINQSKAKLSQKIKQRKKQEKSYCRDNIDHQLLSPPDDIELEIL